MIDRVEGLAEAVETPIGYLPRAEDIDTNGIDVDSDTMNELLAIDSEGWKQEVSEVGEYFDSYGSRIPESLRAEHQAVVNALG